MTNFACLLCERTYVHNRNLVHHVKANHSDGNRQEARNQSLPIKIGLGFKCDQCGCLYMHRRSLDRHVSRNHTDNPTFDSNQCGKSCARSGNLKMHKRACTGPTVAVAVPAAKRRRTGVVVPEFTVRKTRKSLEGAAEMFAVNMKVANHLSALKEAVIALKKQWIIIAETIVRISFR